MRNSRGIVLGALVVTGLLLTMSGTASAQAWLPPKGEATLSIGWGFNWASHHVDYLGNPNLPGDMLFHSALSDLSYGVTNRLAVSVNLPFVVSKYGGQTPHKARAAAPPGAPLPDDGTWNGTFQDFRAEVRFRATTGSFAVTPIVALVVPSHFYEYLAHSAPGRGLTEGQFGVNVGRVLDPILPKAYMQARYVFVVPEKPLGIAHNRSDLSLDLGYFVTDSLTATVFGGYARTHGGWRAQIDFPPPTNPDWESHDRLRKAEYVRLGGGLSYALTGSIGVGVSGFATLRSKSDVNMSGVSLSVSYGFSPSQIIKRRKGPKP
jgi:hypothetical protein